MPPAAANAANARVDVEDGSFYRALLNFLAAHEHTRALLRAFVSRIGVDRVLTGAVDVEIVKRGRGARVSRITVEGVDRDDDAHMCVRSALADAVDASPHFASTLTALADAACGAAEDKRGAKERVTALLAGMNRESRSVIGKPFLALVADIGKRPHELHELRAAFVDKWFKIFHIHMKNNVRDVTASADDADVQHVRSLLAEVRGELVILDHPPTPPVDASTIYLCGSAGKQQYGYFQVTPEDDGADEKLLNVFNFLFDIADCGADGGAATRRLGRLVKTAARDGDARAQVLVNLKSINWNALVDSMVQTLGENV
jgi:hypothetical protein